MSELAEDRVYEGTTSTTEVIVAAGVGLVSVEVSDGRVGGFGLLERCRPRDITSASVVTVATDEDVLLRTDEGFHPTGFGLADAVGYKDGTPVAAGPDGRIAILEDDVWHTIGTLEPPVHAISGDLVGTDTGAHRILNNYGLEYTGLRDVRDVAAATDPLAATAEGIYAYTSDWNRVLTGDFRVVSSTSNSMAHAATTTDAFERQQDTWVQADMPTDGALVDVDYGDCPYAVTADGVFLTGDEEWRGHPLGLSNVVGLAVA